MTMTRRTRRVCNQDASTAAFDAVRATSLVSCLDTICWLELVVESANNTADCYLVRIGDAAKFNAKGIRSSMVYNLTVQRQSILLVYQEQSQPVSNSYVWTRRQVNDPQAAKANVRRFAESDRLSQTFIFDGQGKSRINIVTGKLASLMIGGQGDVRGHRMLLSVCQLKFLFIVIVLFGRGRWWRGDAGRGRLPNQTLPFIRFAKQL